MESTLALLNEEIVYYYHLSFINHVFHSVFLSWGLLDACLCNSWRGIPRDLFLLSLTSLSIQPTVCVTLSLFLSLCFCTWWLPKPIHKTTTTFVLAIYLKALMCRQQTNLQLVWVNWTTCP